MNESTPPPPPVAARPTKLKLSGYSLVLGILSITCFAILAGIPAVICGHMALSKIDKSRGTLTGRGKAVAGLVMEYLGCTLATVFWAGLLAAIIIPNYIKARDTFTQNGCLSNLRLIQTAKNQWALDNHKGATDAPSDKDLLPYLFNRQFPQCPAGGVYVINQVSVSPTCSVTNHVLPQP